MACASTGAPLQRPTLHGPSRPACPTDAALRTHLPEHFGVPRTLHPHRAPTMAPMYLQPQTALGVWFHDLRTLATIHGVIVATKGTSQEEEALTLLLHARQVVVGIKPPPNGG